MNNLQRVVIQAIVMSGTGIANIDTRDVSRMKGTESHKQSALRLT